VPCITYYGVNYECFDPVECRAKHANPAENPLFLWCRLFHRCVLAYRYAPVWHFGHFSSLVYSAILFFVSLPFKKNYYHDNQQTNKKRFEQKWKIDPEKNKINPFLSKENP
jgi:hypothetical protein